MPGGGGSGGDGREAGSADGDEAWCSGWGWWQARLALLLALPVLLTGAYGTNYVFLAAPATFRWVTTSNSLFINIPTTVPSLT